MTNKCIICEAEFDEKKIRGRNNKTCSRKNPFNCSKIYQRLSHFFFNKNIYQNKKQNSTKNPEICFQCGKMIKNNPKFILKEHYSVKYFDKSFCNEKCLINYIKIKFKRLIWG